MSRRDDARATRSVPLAAVLLLAMAGPVGAQVFTGDVTDDVGRTLADVAIELFDESERVVVDAVSASDGTFTLSASEPGPYTVRFSRPGHRTVKGGPYDLAADAPLEVLVVMHRAPVELEGIEAEVEGVSPRLVTNGFYERREKGFGYHIDREQIERRGNVRLTELLDPFPGVWIERGFALTGPEQVRNPPLWYGRAGRRCVPSLWIDGMLVRNGGPTAEPLRPDDWVWSLDLEGIEFYGGPAQTPIEFSRSAGCAVLILWTRAPPERRGAGGGP